MGNFAICIPSLPFPQSPVNLHLKRRSVVCQEKLVSDFIIDNLNILDTLIFLKNAFFTKKGTKSSDFNKKHLTCAKNKNICMKYYNNGVFDMKIRISSIELKNFKNVELGQVDFPEESRPQIVGLYGQNGSGKSAVIDALDYLHRFLSGEPFDRKLQNYLMVGTNRTALSLDFDMFLPEGEFVVKYSVELALSKKTENVHISKESIIYHPKRKKAEKSFLRFNSSTNKFTCSDNIKLLDARYKNDLFIVRRLAETNQTSYFFNKEAKKVFKEINIDSFQTVKRMMQTLYAYANMNFFVIKNSHSAIIGANVLLPIAFRSDTEKSIAKGDLAIGIQKPSVLKDKELELLKKIIQEENIVLEKIIPNLTIKVHEYGKDLLPDGTLGTKIALLSNREGVSIPLLYESDGINKIVSVLNALIRVYNDRNTFIAIDELDSGIYEYLFGELLEIFQEGLKGQLLFTSHNLRPLEVLDKENIIFSTTNPKKRYVHMKSVKKNNNLRDMYIRSIFLGGQKDELYLKTNNTEIVRAFREVARLNKNDKN